MAEREPGPASWGWSRDDARRRQLEAGLRMTPAERLEWLERMLDELLPLVGLARDAERRRSPSGSDDDAHAGVPPT